MYDGTEQHEIEHVHMVSVEMLRNKGGIATW